MQNQQRERAARSSRFTMSLTQQCCLISFFAVAISSPLFFNLTCWTVVITYATQVSSVLQAHYVGNSSSLSSVMRYFPEIRDDLTRIKWGHGVNSRLQLNNSLEGRDMVIESDVLLGTIVNDESGKRVPIMAHPPAKTSDLTFEEYIDTIIRARKKKGVKIDFKQLEVVEECLKYLKSRNAEIDFPLFINADIMSGPVNSSAIPLNATRFLSLAKEFFPESVLSVGWTTRFGPDITSWPVKFVNDGHYSFADVKSMHEVLKSLNVTQPVTFPIRAGLSANPQSHKNLIWLLDQMPDSTVTIWSGIYDTVNVKGLVEFMGKVGKQRTYLDVPSGLDCEVRHYDENERD